MLPPSPAASRWRSLFKTFAMTLAGAFAVIAGFMIAFDPFGVGPWPSRPPVLMDLNQRYMYPQVIRSRQFNAVVTGTSTVRLLDPAALDRAFGARFANLAMNSATAWEQAQILDLFLRETPAPHALVMGLDPLWCEADAAKDAKRVTFRAFPKSFYDDNSLNDWPELLSLKAMEIAWRMMLHRFGFMAERLRLDGYEVFTPDESTYDLARARGHIWAGRDRTIIDAPAYTPTATERDGWVFPALAWIDGLIARMPREAAVMLAFTPNHVAGQHPPGSPGLAREMACKAAVAAIGARHGATVVDFRIPSPVTREDSNYWDALHYRLPVASRIVDGLARARATGEDDPDGFYRVLAAPQRAR
jgi:hypothetical protein